MSDAPTAVVFIGPSRGRTPLDVPGNVRLAPPAAFGDLYRAARAGVGRIGLVDAVFEDQPTVWHNEILWALDHGVEVYGGASMGALRAAECAPFGMIGVGAIFEMYRDGTLEDDHEVAVLHGPADLDHMPLTEPLVNVRATLAAARDAGVLTPDEAEAMLGKAHDRYYKTLTWASLLDDAQLGGLSAAADRLAPWLPSGRIDLKRNDAQALIARVSSDPPPAPEAGKTTPSFFNVTSFWSHAADLLDDAGAALSDGERLVLDEMRLDPAAYRRALLRAFARRNAVAEDGSAAAAIDGFREAAGLMSAQDYAAWCAAHHVARPDLERAVAEDEGLEATLDDMAAELAADIVMEARLSGRYPRLHARAMAKLRALDRAGDVGPALSLGQLLDWFAATRGTDVVPEEADDFARGLGLPDRNALHDLLLREYVSDGAAEPSGPDSSSSMSEPGRRGGA